MSDVNENKITAAAHIVNSADNGPVIILSQFNPETVLTDLLSKFFRELNFPEIFQNFGQVNIGNAHPFALALFNEVIGTPMDPTSLFPSITVNDSSDSQVLDEIGMTYEEFALTKSDFNIIKGQVAVDDVFCSDTGIARLEAHFATNTTAVAYKRKFRVQSSIDFNIWSPNKVVTSFLYDAVKQFTLLYNLEIKAAGIDFQGSAHGRRSGDYNFDFGEMLYGANLTAMINIDMSSLYVTVKLGDIKYIIDNPSFHTLGEVD